MIGQGARVQFKEVEIRHRRVMQIAAEARDVNLTRPIKVEVACKLIVHAITNDYATSIFQLNFEVLDSDF